MIILERVKVLRGQFDNLQLSPRQHSIKESLKNMEKILTHVGTDNVLDKNEKVRLFGELSSVIKMFAEETAAVEVEEDIKAMKKKDVKRAYQKLAGVHKKTVAEVCRIIHHFVVRDEVPVLL